MALGRTLIFTAHRARADRETTGDYNAWTGTPAREPAAPLRGSRRTGTPPAARPGGRRRPEYTPLSHRRRTETAGAARRLAEREPGEPRRAGAEPQPHCNHAAGALKRSGLHFEYNRGLLTCQGPDMKTSKHYCPAATFSCLTRSRFRARLALPGSTSRAFLNNFSASPYRPLFALMIPELLRASRL